MPEDQIPQWRTILTVERLAPIVLSLGGLTIGILRGNSLPTAAFYGIIGAVAGMVVSRMFHVRQAVSATDSYATQGQAEPGKTLAVQESAEPGKTLASQIRSALDEGATGLIIVGILLAGAQILVSMINLTGVGVTLSSMIVGGGDSSLLLIGLIVAIVCMILGMGIPTTAAYVLVAATLAPALIEMGVAPITAHMFVFYYATLSVITPPVCVGVFVAAGLAGEKWGLVARRAVVLGAVTYIIPFLFLLYPQMLTPGLNLGYLEAALSGIVFVTAFGYLFGGARIGKWRGLDAICWLAVAVLATIPSWMSLAVAAVALAIMLRMRHKPPVVPAPV